MRLLRRLGAASLATAIALAPFALPAALPAGAQDDSLSPAPNDPVGEEAVPMLVGQSCIPGAPARLHDVTAATSDPNAVVVRLAATPDGESEPEVRVVVEDGPARVRTRARPPDGLTSALVEREEAGVWVDGGDVPTTTGAPAAGASGPVTTLAVAVGSDEELVVVPLPVAPPAPSGDDLAPQRDGPLGPDDEPILWVELVTGGVVQSVTAPVPLAEWRGEPVAWRVPPAVWPQPCASLDPKLIRWPSGPRLQITTTALRLRYSEAAPSELANFPVAWTRDRIELHAAGYGDLVHDIEVDTATGQIEIYGRTPGSGTTAPSSPGTMVIETSTTSTSSTSSTTTTRPTTTTTEPPPTEPPPTDPPPTEPPPTETTEAPPPVFTSLQVDPGEAPPESVPESTPETVTDTAPETTSTTRRSGPLLLVIPGTGPVTKDTVIEVSRADLDAALPFDIERRAVVGVARTVAIAGGGVLEARGELHPYPVVGTPIVQEDLGQAGSEGSRPRRPVAPSPTTTVPDGRTRDESKALVLGLGAAGVLLLLAAAAASQRRR